MPGFLVQQASAIPIAITDTFVVNSEAEMLALSNAQIGDIAIRNDVYKTFILISNDPEVLGNWQEIISPTSQYRAVNALSGTYTLVNADSGKLLTLNNPSPNNATITVPASSDVPWQNGARISLARLGTGNVTIVGGTGVTIYTKTGLNISPQYGFVDLYRLDQDFWLASGDLIA